LLIIPAIDLLGGRCVRLLQGDFDHVLTYDDDALQRVQTYISAGAKRVHVIDLDAARDASHDNHVRVQEIVQYTGVEIQVGGGIRTEEHVEAWFDRGVTYVIIGTLAAEDPDEVMRLAAKWPGRIFIAMDVRGGDVATHGWEQSGPISVQDMVATFKDTPIAGYIHTNIERDGTMSGPDADALRRVVEMSSHPLIASGGISSLEDVRAAEAAGAQGAIIGRALFEGEVKLRELINAMRAQPETESSAP